jgi:BA14K-like protein
MIRQAFLSAALAFAFGAAGMAPAAAAPPVPAKAALSEAQDSVKVDVWHRRHIGIYDPFYHPRRHFRPRHGFSFGIVIGRPGYYAPRYNYYDPFPSYRPYRLIRPHYHHRRVIRIADPHMRWCYNRYRSYDRYSNTFQPYHGRRRVCVSPYY